MPCLFSLSQGVNLARTRIAHLPTKYDEQGNAIVYRPPTASDSDVTDILEADTPLDGRASDSNIFDVLEDDTPLDGRGDSNLSTITPPLPMNLVEPMCHGHETGYHVITTSTAVGISAFQCIF